LPWQDSKGLPMKSDKTPKTGTAEEGVARHRIKQRPEEPLPRDPGDIADDANRDEAAIPRPVTEDR
jgi:hypothetical protein